MGQVIKIFKTLPRLKEGESIALDHQGTNTVEFFHKCCGCGLEHRVRVHKGKKNFTLKFWRK